MNIQIFGRKKSFDTKKQKGTLKKENKISIYKFRWKG